MPTPTQFNFVIVTPDQILYEGPVTKVEVPGVVQNLAILPDHTPLYAELTKGDVVITPVTGTSQSIPIEGGIVRVRSNKVSLIAGF